MTTKDMKVQISSRNEVMQGSGVMEYNGSHSQGGLLRQPSMNKNNCLCSPTTHAGSFRCRLHRTPSLTRTKSMESSSSSSHDQASLIHASVVVANGDANKN
ncbi:unnamed protein product [Lathyrus sativus]|nr:unnamed protein product [Lathyrus sativus]